MNGDYLINVFAALSHPIRMKAVAYLVNHGAIHVSQLARMIGISRPLLILHVKKLEAAGILVSEMTLSDDGKAMKMLSVAPFSMTITPELLRDAAKTITET